MAHEDWIFGCASKTFNPQIPTPNFQSLEREIRDFSQERGKRLKAAQDKLKKAKSDLEAARKILKLREQKLQEAVAEAEAAEKELQGLDAKIEGADKAVQGESGGESGWGCKWGRSEDARRLIRGPWATSSRNV